MTKKAPQEAPSLRSDPQTDAPQTTPPAENAGRRPFETFLPGLKSWEAAAVRAYGNWPAGFEISETDFNAARDAALGQVIK